MEMVFFGGAELSVLSTPSFAVVIFAQTLYPDAVPLAGLTAIASGSVAVAAFRARRPDVGEWPRRAELTSLPLRVIHFSIVFFAASMGVGFLASVAGTLWVTPLGGVVQVVRARDVDRQVALVVWYCIERRIPIVNHIQFARTTGPTPLCDCEFTTRFGEVHTNRNLGIDADPGETLETGFVLDRRLASGREVRRVQGPHGVAYGIGGNIAFSMQYKLWVLVYLGGFDRRSWARARVKPIAATRVAEPVCVR
jgi:hypothetical protein